MKISVALCTYNGEKFIEQQLNSILNQTLKIDEIVVCDDYSTDSTLEILKSYQKKHPSIFKIYRNEITLKSNKNFEKALNLSSGDYIFFSDQDDIWIPEKVEQTLQIFLKNNSVEGVFSNGLLIDHNNNVLPNNISLWDCSGFFESQLIKPIDLLKLMIIEGNFVTGATLCIKKEVKEICLPFKTNEKNMYHDYWIGLLLAERNTLSYINKNLISYRIHDNQQIGVGNFMDRYKSHKNHPEAYKLILGYYKPKKFNEYKLITRFFYDKYIFHKNNHNPFYDNFINQLIEQNLFLFFKKAKTTMILKFPFKYLSKKIRYTLKKDSSLNFDI